MCKNNTYSYLWLENGLQAIDSCIAPLLIQLNNSAIKTIASCCGHGKGYPRVTCAPGTEAKLKEFGCRIVVTREDKKVEAYFPVESFFGRVYPVKR
jgi:hypothetical protein